MQDFHAAGRRHYEDAVLLCGDQRFPNADHLAGFAAECALKEILVRFLGAVRTDQKPYTLDGGKKTHHGHLPVLWGQVVTALQGRMYGGAFAALLAAGNPYQSWSVNDRYEDGSAVGRQLVGTRLEVTRRILEHLESAKLLGALR